MRNLLSFFFLFGALSFAQQPDPLITSRPDLQKKWVDSVFQSMSLDQKIGQLFTPMVFSKNDEKHFEEIKSLIEAEKINGSKDYDLEYVRSHVNKLTS